MRDTNDHVERSGRHDRGEQDHWQREREREERANAATGSGPEERAVHIMQRAIAKWLGPTSS